MVTPAIGIALSGLNAASLRMQNSASNIANMHSTRRIERGEEIAEPYQPTDVVQTSLEPTGGVRADLRLRDPASVDVYAPGHADADAEGIVAYPNVNLEEEIVQTQIAGYDYKANLKVLETADQMLKSILDIKG